MDASELTHYLADEPPSVVRLEIEKHFEALTDKQKRYAHFISKYVGPLFWFEVPACRSMTLTPLPAEPHSQARGSFYDSCPLNQSLSTT